MIRKMLYRVNVILLYICTAGIFVCVSGLTGVLVEISGLAFYQYIGLFAFGVPATIIAVFAVTIYATWR